MAYRDDISALAPDHYWTLDGNYNDTGDHVDRPFGLNNVGAVAFDPLTLSEDATQSLKMDGANARTECADSDRINTTAQPRRTMGGWYMVTDILRPPTAIYKEGGGTNNIAVLLGFGNNVIAQAVDKGDFDIQVFADRPLTPNRAYHLMFKFEGSATGNEFSFFVDGIKQATSVPANGAPDTATMAGHGADISFGDPDSNLNVGGTAVGFAGPSPAAFYQHWATWTTGVADSQIYTLFETGALPTHTVTSQAQLDALANSTISETPLAIRVDVAGSIALDATDIVFSHASIDVQYTGTGTLTWLNKGASNAAVTSAPNGGTVVIGTESSLTLTGLEANTEVRVFDAADPLTELAGAESVNTGTFTTTINSAATPLLNIAVMSLGFQMIRLIDVDMSADVTIPIQQQLDRQYQNL